LSEIDITHRHWLNERTTVQVGETDLVISQAKDLSADRSTAKQIGTVNCEAVKLTYEDIGKLCLIVGLANSAE
jgi:hypothetical protein